jgi:phosphatidylglycerophosphate synthase
MVNKIPQELDNPIDNFINNIVDTQLDLYKNVGLTPNGLTTISLLLGLSTSYFAYNNKYIIASATWLLSYYFDCADGKMARKFKMTSKFGDLYDHSSDILKHFILFYVLYNKLDKETKKIKYLIISLVIIIGLLTAAQVGCQEKMTRQITNKETESPTLKIAEYLVITDCDKQIKFTRFFGPATIIMYVIIVMIFLGRK